MFKEATYRKAFYKNGLFALSLVFSLFAFPGIVNSAEACRLQPQHIEVIVDGQDVDESTVFTYLKTNSDFTANTLQTTRDYECNVQRVYQRQVKETLNTILKHSFNYSSPVSFRITNRVSSLRDDTPPLSLG